MHFYITGDTHGDFDRIEAFCDEYETTKDDVMIILGDAGINYYLDEDDAALKEQLSKLNITLFCIHGNHEARPWEAEGYEEMTFAGAKVYAEKKHPSILFAKDGEIYNFNGKSVIAIGGAYSVDKQYRLDNNMKWFDTEQPDEATRSYVEDRLEAVGWAVDVVLSHTVPIKAEPKWAFLTSVDQSTLDKSTEKWLQRLCDRLDFREWYAGHYHVESRENGIRIMFEDYHEICREYV